MQPYQCRPLGPEYRTSIRRPHRPHRRSPASSDGPRRGAPGRSCRARLASSSRALFFAVAAKAMRHILCNHARDRSRQKRGGGVPHLRLAPGQDVAAQVPLSDDQTDMRTALDDALRELQRNAPRQASVVECRFFARAWLQSEMRARMGDPD